MIGLLRRLNGRRKLAKGQCINCAAILRDDATDHYCSDKCADDWVNSNAY